MWTWDDYEKTSQNHMNWERASDAVHSEGEEEGETFMTKIPDIWETPELPDTTGSMTRRMARNRKRNFMTGRSQEKDVVVLQAMENRAILCRDESCFHWQDRGQWITAEEDLYQIKQAKGQCVADSAAKNETRAWETGQHPCQKGFSLLVRRQAN